MHTEFNFTIWGAIVLALGAIHPEAAAGAVCGGFFFWSLSPEIPLSTRVWLLFGSVGLGYGMALPVVLSDTGWAWIVAGFGASMVHVVIVALRSMVVTGSPWPEWLKDFIDLLPMPWRKNRGGKDERD